MSFKICCIGCGYMAAAGHGPAYRRYADFDKDVVLAACCDIDSEKAIAFKNRFGFVKSYTDVTAMLSSEKPDAVCLVVPVDVIKDMSINIMRMGYPLIVEKPPGKTSQETLQMIDVAEESGVPNQVAFNRRYMPLVSNLKAILVDNFKPDDIDNIRYDFSRVGRTERDFSTTAIHGIDTVRYLYGLDYRYIRFHYQEHNDLGQWVASIFMDCIMESGATAQLNFTPISGASYERATVNLNGNTFFLHVPLSGSMEPDGRLIHLNRNEVKLDVTGRGLSVDADNFVLCGFYDENASFFNDLRNGRMPAGDIRSGLQSVEIADCIRRRLPEYRS